MYEHARINSQTVTVVDLFENSNPKYGVRFMNNMIDFAEVCQAENHINPLFNDRFIEMALIDNTGFDEEFLWQYQENKRLFRNINNIVNHALSDNEPNDRCAVEYRILNSLITQYNESLPHEMDYYKLEKERQLPSHRLAAINNFMKFYRQILSNENGIIFELKSYCEDARADYYDALSILKDEGLLDDEGFERAKYIVSNIPIDISDPLFELLQSRIYTRYGCHYSKNPQILINALPMFDKDPDSLEGSNNKLSNTISKVVFHELTHAITSNWHNRHYLDSPYEDFDNPNNDELFAYSAFPNFLNEALCEDIAQKLYYSYYGYKAPHQSYSRERFIVNQLLSEKSANVSKKQLYKAFLDSTSALNNKKSPLESYKIFRDIHASTVPGLFKKYQHIINLYGIDFVSNIVNSHTYKNDLVKLEGLISSKKLNNLEYLAHRSRFIENNQNSKSDKIMLNKAKIQKLAEICLEKHNIIFYYHKHNLLSKHYSGFLNVEEKLIYIIFGPDNYVKERVIKDNFDSDTIPSKKDFRNAVRSLSANIKKIEYLQQQNKKLRQKIL